MFIGITSTPRDYAWGSRTAIAELLGRKPSGGPEAELWLGAHPAWPSVVTDGTPEFGGRPLDAVIAENPARFLGPRYDRLPFLLKVLAAESPLSLQAHPDAEQARAGFARENAAGIPLDAPERNYRDASPKPELILALSATFEALAGFRHLSESRMLFTELAGAASDPGTRRPIAAFADRLGTAGGGLRDCVDWLLRRGDGVGELVEAVTRASAHGLKHSSFGREFATVGRLAEAYPGDPGIVLSLLLNRISLVQAQALFLPAGNVHAYLHGLGIELMASSDNVLRGGLTPKHIDVDELLDVVVFEARPIAVVQSDEPVPGVEVFRTDGDDFVLARIALGDAGEVHGYRLTGPDDVTFTLTGPAIVLVVRGGIRIDGETDRMNLGRGDAALITPDEGRVTFSGSGIAYLATTP